MWHNGSYIDIGYPSDIESYRTEEDKRRESQFHAHLVKELNALNTEIKNLTEKRDKLKDALEIYREVVEKPARKREG
jgi:predicted  nucleic acid-binding Zn-ribbon protein